MKVLNSNKPVYVMNESLNKMTNKFDSLFKLSMKQSLLILDNAKEFKKNLKKKEVTSVDKNKTFFLSNTLSSESKNSITSSYPLNYTKNASNADYLILGSNFYDLFKSVPDNWLGVIETEDKILLLINRPSFFKWKFSTPGKFYKYLTKNKIIGESTYTMYSSTQYLIMQFLDSYNNIEEILNSSSKLVREEEFLKTMSDTHEILEKENLTMLDELLKSRDKDSVVLALKILATSSYMKTPYAIRALVLKNCRNIKNKTGYYYGTNFPEQALYDNLHLGDVINYPASLKGVGSANVIFGRNFENDERDLALCREILYATYKEGIENLLSVKTQNALEKAGFKLNLSLE